MAAGGWILTCRNPTHVAASGEIGAVRVAKVEKKGKRNRRVAVVFDE